MKAGTREALKFYLAVALFHYYTYAHEFLKFQRHSNDTIRLSRKYNTKQQLTLPACCMHCQNDKRCYGVSFQEATKTCELNDKNTFYDVFDPEIDGTWVVYIIKNAAAIGDLCNTNADCRAENSNCKRIMHRSTPRRCICKYLHKFDEETHACTRVCESYGTTFTQYPGKAILSNNEAIVKVDSTEECLEFCIAKEEICRAFMYNGHKCYAKQLSMQQALDGLVLEENSSMVLYDRDCE